MKIIKILAALAISGMVSACATAPQPVELANGAPAFAAADTDIQEMPAYRVTDINVRVPRSLTVSEANRYYPSSDIVWREDPLGDRHAQVQAIFEDAMARGTKDMDGIVPVELDIEVLRFHALTEKTRYTIGGVHSITFEWSVRNAETGLALGAPKVVEADLVGFGGQRAIEAEQKGHTQKVRITGHLSNVIRTELEMPQGYKNERLGPIQVLNRF